MRKHFRRSLTTAENFAFGFSISLNQSAGKKKSRKREFLFYWEDYCWFVQTMKNINSKTKRTERSLQTTVV